MPVRHPQIQNGPHRNGENNETGQASWRTLQRKTKRLCHREPRTDDAGRLYERRSQGNLFPVYAFETHLPENRKYYSRGDGCH